MDEHPHNRPPQRFMPASGRARIQAFFWDYTVVLTYLAMLAVVGTWLTVGPLAESWQAMTSTPTRTDALAFVTAVVPVTLYFALSESLGGRTWGKAKAELYVVNVNGGPVTIGRSLARSGLKFLPWQLSHTAMLHIPGFPFEPGEPPAWSLAVLLAAWTLTGAYVVGLMPAWQGRTLYDRIAGTAVVSQPD